MAERPLGLSLHLIDGGTWQLDEGAEAYALVGHRVRMEGIRSGFDMVDVVRIEIIEAGAAKECLTPSRDLARIPE